MKYTHFQRLLRYTALCTYSLKNPHPEGIRTDGLMLLRRMHVCTPCHFKLLALQVHVVNSKVVELAPGVSGMSHFFVFGRIFMEKLAIFLKTYAMTIFSA
jgi:hypothetical protein